MQCFYLCIPRERSNFDSNTIVEVQPTNTTTSTVLPVQENLTASDDPPTYAQAIEKKETEINFTPSAGLTETVSTDPRPSVPDLTQEIFTNPPNVVDTPWVASTPPSPPGLTQYWTPETSPRDSQFSPSQTFFSPFE